MCCSLLCMAKQQAFRIITSKGTQTKRTELGLLVYAGEGMSQSCRLHFSTSKRHLCGADPLSMQTKTNKRERALMSLWVQEVHNSSTHTAGMIFVLVNVEKVSCFRRLDAGANNLRARHAAASKGHITVTGRETLHSSSASGNQTCFHALMGVWKLDLSRSTPRGWTGSDLLGPRVARKATTREAHPV
jgi:hypothetical protein